MVVIDVSLAVGPGMPCWPGDPPVAVAPWAVSGPARVSELRLGTHTGTHVDPPAHFVAGGATVDRLDLDALVGPAVVADLRGRRGPIGAADLDALGLAAGVARLLLRTDNSARWEAAGPAPGSLPERWVALDLSAARWLVARRVRLVGFDFLSVEAAGDGGYPVHRILLEAGVVLVEGLDLSAAEPGEYGLACLPLKVAGGDGAPARCVLYS